ncbi:MAG: ABC transporter ATP-binding protein, partial [Planctomycetaceae bacterium]
MTATATTESASSTESDAQTPLLSVRDLRKSYDGIKAVDGVSFHVAAGEIFGLLGPNGAGKSTTMMIIAGLLRPDAGEIALDGETFDPRRLDLRSMLGVVPQDLALYPELTAQENLSFFGRLYGLKGAKLKDRVDGVLQRVGLTDRARDRAGTYSGGMKRRLNFAIGLLHRPRLLILDEPTVGVDP